MYLFANDGEVFKMPGACFIFRRYTAAFEGTLKSKKAAREADLVDHGLAREVESNC